MGRPSPRAQNSWIAVSSLGVSSLLTARKTGFPERWRMRATSSSPAAAPVLPSTRKTTASASSAAMIACLRMESPNASSVISSMPAGVDQHELAAVPVGAVVAAIASDAAHLVHDGVMRLDQPVDERGLAHVRPSDHGYDRKGHGLGPSWSGGAGEVQHRIEQRRGVAGYHTHIFTRALAQLARSPDRRASGRPR